MDQQQAGDCMTILKQYLEKDIKCIQFSSQLGTTVLPHNEGLAVTIGKHSVIKEKDIALQSFPKMSVLVKQINVNQSATYGITLRGSQTGYYFLIERNKM